MTAAVRGGRKPASIRTLWAIAKSPELGLSSEDLHAVVYRETGKESIKKLTQGEIDKLARVLQNMKDGVKRGATGKRTDEGGDPRTMELRRKMYAICSAMGRTEPEQVVNGLSKRMFGIERQEWLTSGQCIKLIEALKAIAAREQKEGRA